MVYDTKEKQMIVGLEMEDAEAIGLPKYDILAVRLLDKIAAAAHIALTGDM
jgi:DNA polymerase III alpha subunit